MQTASGGDGARTSAVLSALALLLFARGTEALAKWFVDLEGEPTGRTRRRRRRVRIDR
jgi:hypothetical protein